jgi:hypothetical protein
MIDLEQIDTCINDIVSIIHTRVKDNNYLDGINTNGTTLVNLSQTLLNLNWVREKLIDQRKGN